MILLWRPSCNCFECLNEKKPESLFLSLVVVAVVMPPDLFLSLCICEFYFMPRFGLFAHFFYATFWIVHTFYFMP